MLKTLSLIALLTALSLSPLAQAGEPGMETRPQTSTYRTTAPPDFNQAPTLHNETPEYFGAKPLTSPEPRPNTSVSGPQPTNDTSFYYYSSPEPVAVVEEGPDFMGGLKWCVAQPIILVSWTWGFATDVYQGASEIAQESIEGGVNAGVAVTSGTFSTVGMAAHAVEKSLDNSANKMKS